MGRIKLFFFVVLLPLALGVFWGVRKCSGPKKSPSRPPAVSPARSPVPVAASTVESPSSSDPNSLPGICENWGKSTSGLVWGWDASGDYYEGHPVSWVRGRPLFSSRSRVDR